MKKVDVEISETIAFIRIDDGKVNAAGFDMLEELNSAIDLVEDRSDCVILSGRPGLLSGGFDLSVLNGGDAKEINALVKLGIKTLMRLFGFRKPLIIIAPGHAVALGAFMLLAADYRIGVKGDFKIGLNETAIGLPIPLFGISLVQARLNPKYIARAAFSAELFNPEDSVEVGFLDFVADEDNLEKEAKKVAARLKKLDMAAFENTKMAFRRQTIDRVLEHTEKNF
tara:strand:+ start:227 stop:904 length:678 start_codon:yes stop_codon:yes gene_type:complete